MSANLQYDTSSDPQYLQNQLALARREIHNLRQQLTALNHVHRKECDYIQTELQKWQCLECRRRQNSDDSLGAAGGNENPIDFQCSYIGTISTHFPEKRGTPRQPGICGDMIAKLTLNNQVFTNPSHALEGLQEFSHMWILFHFHKNDSTHVRAKVAPPRLNGLRTGVFASRSPHRPCPIGQSLVKIDRIMDNTIYFSGVDMVDQTPVLDIKPYIPQYDNPGLANSFYPEESILEPATVVETAVRQLDGEENGQRDYTLGAPAAERSHPNRRSEDVFYTRSSSRMGEREAPDGEEEESSRTQTGATSPPEATASASTSGTEQIRVPPWIDQPPVSRLSVAFKDRALAQLSHFPDSEEKKTIITNILREDPRSAYLRERGSHCYVFRISDLYVSCKFNDNTHSVIVFQVFQNEVPEGGGDD